jgi:hypothetical protein
MSTLRKNRRVLLLLLACSVCAPAFGDTVKDEDVKLALIYKIARFVSWPATPDQQNGPFRVCVAEQAVFEVAQDRYAGRKIRDRDIDVRLIKNAATSLAEQCDILYMARAKQDRVTEFLELVSGQPVLTINDDPEFARIGGMIGLSTRGNKITISINVGAYEASNLTVSSQLLELAELVNDNRTARR